MPVMVQNKPVSAPAGHKERGREHGKEVRWTERRGREERAAGRKKKGRMREQDDAAVDCPLWRPAAV